MSKNILGVGAVGVTKDPGSTLKTFALGSCVAVILFDPAQRAIGMAHIALPRSKTNPERAKQSPGYFADTGLELLFEQMATLGCDPGGKGMVVKLVGGAKVLDMDASIADGIWTGRCNL
jgi:chemotaxis protein CheD